MTFVYVAWLGLFAVLAVGIAFVVQAAKELREAPKQTHPLLRLKARYDRGEITREEFEHTLRQQLDREHEPRKVA